MSDISAALFLYIIIILSAIVHEYAHAWAAWRQGDPTAKYAGRLTLNPLAHIDPLGTILIPLILLMTTKMFFGYAKPVPINPYNFRNQRSGLFWVSIAGVAANFAIAIVLGLTLRFGFGLFMANFLSFIVMINIWLGLFNLLPFPPLDGSKILMSVFNIDESRTSGFADFFGSTIGTIVAIFVAMMFLPGLSAIIYKLIVGHV